MSLAKVDNKKNNIIAIISGVLVSVATTLVLILVFALLIRVLSIPDGVIFPINQVIKVISLFLGCLIINKRTHKNGIINGLLLGLLYFVLSFVLFAILQGSISWVISNFFDLVLTSVMGGLVGLVSIHITK